jgi:CRISPR-associated protein Cas1
MKRHLNTLFITQNKTYLAKEGESISVKLPEQAPRRFPIHNIGSIVCFGDILCTPALMEHCVKNKTTISFLSTYGKFRARITGPVSGNVLLRKEQYRWSDSVMKSAKVARYFLIGKIHNSRLSLMRSKREHKEIDRDGSVSEAIRKLGVFIESMKEERTLDDHRGIEGMAANTYFGVFDNLVIQNKHDFYFHERNKRPPRDRVNALLSFSYTMLLNDIRSALEIVGLDPAVGFLHRDRPGRPSLALDLMEEFRTFFSDRLVLSLINTQRIRSNHFEPAYSGGIYLNEEGRKIFLSTYQERKQMEIYHPYIEEKTTLGLLFHIQAMLLARYIRGDIEGYPPFLWR